MSLDTPVGSIYESLREPLLRIGGWLRGKPHLL
jgi:hypothetical protein